MQTITEQQNEFNTLVDRLEAHQQNLGLTDRQFVARYQKFLGSPKTWTDRFKAKSIEEFGTTFPAWLAKARMLVGQIDGGTPVELLFDSLPITQYADDLFQRLQGQKTDRRNAMLIGTYGIGKTQALRRLQRLHVAESVYVRANETWKESKMVIASALARMLGRTRQDSAAGTFQEVIEFLTGNPVTIFIDESHEGGVLLFKLVKTLIDETPAKFILSSYPTAWNRLTSGVNEAYAEAQQLLGRTLKPVNRDWFQGLRLEDVLAYLRAATPWAGRCEELAQAVLPVVKQNGALRTLADAIANAEVQAAVLRTELTPKLVLEEARRQAAVVASDKQ